MSQNITSPPLPIQDGIRFRLVPEFPGYCVGDDGSVWTCWANGGWGQGRRYLSWQLGGRWRHMKASRCKRSGRLRLTLHHCSGKLKCVSVHTLVLTAFVSPRPAGLVCCHWDGDPANNELGNLRWGTPADNSADRDRHGRTPSGESAGGAKLGEADVRQIRDLLRAGERQKDVAARFNVCPNTIGWIARGGTWKDLV